MPQDCICMQSKQQANEAPGLLWIQWFEGHFTDPLGRSDFAKGVGYGQGRRGRHKCPSGSGSQTRTILRHHALPLVAAVTLGLAVTLDDLTWLATLISAHSIPSFLSILSEE